MLIPGEVLGADGFVHKIVILPDYGLGTLVGNLQEVEVRVEHKLDLPFDAYLVPFVERGGFLVGELLLVFGHFVLEGFF